MSNELENLRAKLPEPAKDIRLNLQSVFQTTSLTPVQLWGVAIASAVASRNQTLATAVIADSKSALDAATIAAVIKDATAAAALMGMNNIYYRFRHIVGKDVYSSKPARLRMNWIGKPRTNKADFELICLAVSAINGCEACVKSHESAVTEAGLTEDQVHDAIRTASTIHAAAIGLEVSDLAAGSMASSTTAL